MVGTLAYWCGEGEGHKCGYCKSIDTSLSYGMVLNWTTCQTYQSLIDKGWRRSGTYCYKPTMDKTCCPQYTIRCNPTLFRPSRSQKKVIKTFNNFLMSNNKLPTNDSIPELREVSEKSSSHVTTQTSEQIDTVTTHHTPSTSKQIGASHLTTHHAPSTSSSQQYKTATMLANSSKKRDKRRLKKLEKIALLRGVDVETLDVRDLGPAPFIPNLKQRLSVADCDRLVLKVVKVSQNDAQFLSTFKQSHQLYTAYQMEIHGDTAEKCCEETFQRFLCDPPFENEEHLGSFHQQYWLDGVLVAVGVLDVLPHCVSSVYFYYHPSLKSLTFGTYSALREIQFTMSLSEQYPDIQWYYMGYYIHNCIKMKYKGFFSPSFLLCPKDYTWWPIETCVPMLDQSSYCVFSDNVDITDNVDNTDNPSQATNLNPLYVVYANKIYQYQLYRDIVSKDIYREALVMLIHLVGYETARQICIFCH